MAQYEVSDANWRVILTMTDDPAFQDLMTRLQVRDENAAREVFQTFARRLIGLAHRRLDVGVRGRVDPEDVVQSAFESFFRRQAEGQWELENWDGLWSMLAVITVRKCRRQNSKARTARRDVGRESAKPPPGESSFLGHAASPEPTPEEAVMLAELVERLMGCVDERDSPVVLLTLQGEPVADIAKAVGCSERKVYRLQESLRRYLEKQRDEVD